MDNRVLEEDKRLQAHLASLGAAKTRQSYSSAWETYLEFYREEKKEETTPAKLLEAIVEDRKKPLEERGGPEMDFVAWASWLHREYQKRNGHGEKVGKKGLGSTTVRGYAVAIKSFYTYYDHPLGRKAKLPRTLRANGGKLENIKIEFRPEQVKKLLSAVRSLRDRAIILLMFQSGMDISTACSLNYGHIKEELEAGKEPLLINVTRPKVGLNYRTFIGRDAIEAIRAYLEDRTRRQGEKLGYDTSLFMQEGRGAGRRCRPKHFQDNMRNYVISAGLVSKERLERADLSPARPHALRSGFSSILRLKGANERQIDYWMGHADPYGGAYNQAGDEELREVYKGFEQYLSISGVSSLGEVEERLKKELARRDDTIEGMKGRVGKLEGLLHKLTGIRPDEVDLQDVSIDPTTQTPLVEIMKRRYGEAFVESLRKKVQPNPEAEGQSKEDSEDEEAGKG